VNTGAVTMQQFADVMRAVFGGPEPARRVERPSSWDRIVGIDLDEWMRADTPEQVEWLAWLRDHPMPQQGPAPCSCEQIEITSYGDGVVRHVRGRVDPGCLAHPSGNARDVRY